MGRSHIMLVSAGHDEEVGLAWKSSGDLCKAQHQWPVSQMRWQSRQPYSGLTQARTSARSTREDTGVTAPRAILSSLSSAGL